MATYLLYLVISFTSLIISIVTLTIVLAKLYNKKYLTIPVLILLFIIGEIFLTFGFNLLFYSIFLIFLISILLILFYFGIISLEVLIILVAISLFSYIIVYLYFTSAIPLYSVSYSQLVPVISTTPIY
ncbi:hypothetical protein YN1_5340 [Nanoarchaeota archaeon]